VPIWPVTLPQMRSWQGYTRKIQDTRIRTPMDAGPPKLRSKYTANLVEHEMQMDFFTKAQWVLLEAFYVTTLLQGTQPFEWTDPISGATVNFRFKAPPMIGSMLGPDTIPVTLSLEVLP